VNKIYDSNRLLEVGDLYKGETILRVTEDCQHYNSTDPSSRCRKCPRIYYSTKFHEGRQDGFCHTYVEKYLMGLTK
jgi:hypothetical protein